MSSAHDFGDRTQLLQAMGFSVAEELSKWFPTMEPMDVHILSMQCAEAALAAIRAAELPAAQEFISRLEPN
jgi:hypothetical protein